MIKRSNDYYFIYWVECLRLQEQAVEFLLLNRNLMDGGKS